MGNFIVIFLLIFSLTGFAQDKDNITVGKQVIINSSVLNEQRELWVCVPEELNRGTENQKVYPVIYLLDGENLFYLTSGIIEFLSKNDLCPKMIIVGIINKNRGRDLSPTQVSSWPGSGGADNLTKFLKNELIPYIDSHYATASYKMLIGHSLAGGFAIYSLIHFSDIFDSYIAIDPSICWDNNILVKQMKESIGKIDFSKEVVYIPYTFSEKNFDSLQIRKDTSEITQCIRSKFEFYDILNSLQSNKGISVKSNFYKKEAHSYVPLISIYDGIQFIFDFYKPPVIPNNIDTLKNAKKIIQNHYDTVSEKIGFKVLPPDNLIETVLYMYQLNNLNDRMNDILELKNK